MKWWLTFKVVRKDGVTRKKIDRHKATNLDEVFAAMGNGPNDGSEVLLIVAGAEQYMERLFDVAGFFKHGEARP